MCVDLLGEGCDLVIAGDIQRAMFGDLRAERAFFPPRPDFAAGPL